MSTDSNRKSVVGLSGLYLCSYMVFCMFLIAIQILWRDIASDDSSLGILNTIVPILLSTSSLLLVWKLLRDSPLALYNPMTCFLLVCALYYGIGQLIHIWGNEDSIRRVNTLYYVNRFGLARTNLLNTFGLTVAVGVYTLTSTFLSKLIRNENIYENSIELERGGVKEAKVAVLLFLLVGLPVKYFFELPYNVGLIDYVLPGSIKNLGSLSGVAIIPLYWLTKRRGGIYRPSFYALVTMEFLVSIISLSKLEIIKTSLLIVWAIQLYNPGVKKIILSGAVTILLYVFLASPFVNFAREYLGRAYAKNISETVKAAEKFQQKGGAVRDLEFPRAQLWWTRLAYSNVELFAMDQYDRGKPGNTFLLAPYTLIPRFLYPTKPIMVSGLELTYTITRDRSIRSHTGLGVFGEGYWNGGWWGIALASSIVGALLSFFAFFSQRVISAQAFLYLPVIVAGLMMGLRVDDWFVPTYLGATIQALLLYLILRFAFRPIFGFKTP